MGTENSEKRKFGEESRIYLYIYSQNSLIDGSGGSRNFVKKGGGGAPKREVKPPNPPQKKQKINVFWVWNLEFY
jgi:hypothetical protein